MKNIKDQLDVSDYFNGKMDDWIEKRHFMLEFFKGKRMSIFIVDPNNEMSLDVITSAFPEFHLKTFDLADCKEGDFTRIGRHLEPYFKGDICGYNGLLFDNVDCINAGEDTIPLQNMVWQSLKRDSSEFGGFQIIPGNTIPFDKISIAVRCKEIPDYLENKSLMAYRVLM